MVTEKHMCFGGSDPRVTVKFQPCCNNNIQTTTIVDIVVNGIPICPSCGEDSVLIETIVDFDNSSCISEELLRGDEALEVSAIVNYPIWVSVEIESVKDMELIRERLIDAADNNLLSTPPDPEIMNINVRRVVKR